MLDHLEQLESYFADALAKEAEVTDKQIASSASFQSTRGGPGGGIGGERERGGVREMGL